MTPSPYPHLPPRRTGRNRPVTLAGSALVFRVVDDPVTAEPALRGSRPVVADALVARGLITDRQHHAAETFRDIVEAAERVAVASPGLEPRVSGGGGDRDPVPAGRLRAQRRLSAIGAALGAPAMETLRAVIVDNSTLGALAYRESGGRGRAKRSVSAALRAALNGLAAHLAAGG